MPINVNITPVSNKRKYEFIRSMRLIIIIKVIIIKMTFYQKYVLYISTVSSLKPFATL